MGDIAVTISASTNQMSGFYKYHAHGNDGVKIGVGWYGNRAYYIPNTSAGITLQTGTNTSVSVGAGVEGISLGIGFDTGNNISSEVSVSVGWGTIACYAAATVLMMIPEPVCQLSSALLWLIGGFI